MKKKSLVIWATTMFMIPFELNIYNRGNIHLGIEFQNYQGTVDPTSNCGKLY